MPVSGPHLAGHSANRMFAFLQSIRPPKFIRRAYRRLTGRDRARQPFRPSVLAKQYCRGQGLEIGGAAHNPFGLNTRNVDYTRELNFYKQGEIARCGRCLPVDIEASGDAVPLPDGSVDFVVSSHVLEHFPDPIKALREWYRLVRPGGILFMIVPHKERTFDCDRPRTTLAELLDRHAGRAVPADPPHDHYSVWTTEDLLELVIHMNRHGLFPAPVAIAAVQDVDDKVGNGFTVVLRK